VQKQVLYEAAFGRYFWRGPNIPCNHDRKAGSKNKYSTVTFSSSEENKRAKKRQRFIFFDRKLTRQRPDLKQNPVWISRLGGA